MSGGKKFQARLMGGAAFAALMFGGAAAAAEPVRFDIAPQSLTAALNEFGVQSSHAVLFTTDLTGAKVTQGVSREAEPEVALAQMLTGTGLGYRRSGDTFLIIKADADPQGGSAAGGGAEVEGLIVTAQKREENIQDVPIAMSAFSQETLTERQVAGGPDLITQIPNMSFTKTNFTSYSIQIRGIGTQAISATTDPAVAVAFNNTPFVRNHFFEQEFYDLERLEVLRGPQGTLYGRNATAGVVNLISAKPKFTFDAKASADVANYNSTRIEGMVNIPLVADVVALRLAGAWTKREGYATNQMTGTSIDGRDLWSTRVSLRFEPTDSISANLIWEHFEEDDDRLRSGKQLCKKDVVEEVGGLPVEQTGGVFGEIVYLSLGCAPVSLYSPEAFQTPNGFSLPYYGPTGGLGNIVFGEKDPYLGATQSRDLRVIESSVEPVYRAKMDLAELQISVDLTEGVTLSSETSYNADELWSLQDYNRFTTAPQAFRSDYNSDPAAGGFRPGLVDANGVFCDPQIGCSDRLLLVDLSTSESTQFSQEFRLGSDFDGPFNFSLGANYLRHDAVDKYYVFINSLTMFAGRATSDYMPWEPGVTDNSDCFGGPGGVGDTANLLDPNRVYRLNGCTYIDPNPVGALNDQGRNYFLSLNPYKLISYAAFGEIYYNITPDLKLTGGFRLTVDRKTAPQIPSWLLASSQADPSHPIAGDYPTAATVFQEWREPTGRLALDWKPDLSFTDETLVYASYAHGYKAGGANPPPPVLVTYTAADGREVIPETFGPEFVDAFEVGTKNTLLDGALTLNLTGFYYDYKGYQTSEIRNRAAVNSNYDAEVWGAEVEADWRINEALRLGFKGGYNGTRMGDGQQAIDLMDRTAGRDDWVVVRPFPTIPSNCIIPVYVATAGGEFQVAAANNNVTQDGVCVDAYYGGLDPVTGRAYVPNPTLSRVPSKPVPAGYIGWNPLDESQEHNSGDGFFKDLGGNELPNAPRYTSTVTVDYTLPLAGDWLMTLHGDYHYQSASWARVFNFNPYDRINAFSTVNLSAIFNNDEAGWKVMAYVKNVFDETAITGAFLNSDDTGLTTNVFLTEPRLYGLRVTKDFTGGGRLGEIGRCDDICPVTVEIGGGVGRYSAETTDYAPAWLDIYNDDFSFSQAFQDEDLDLGDTRSVELTYAPSADWRVSAAYRFGKTNSGVAKEAAYQDIPGSIQQFVSPAFTKYDAYAPSQPNHLRAAARDAEEYEIVDFMVGRNVDFGALGGGSSVLSAGLRRAELQSTSSVRIDGIPNRVQRPDFSPITPFDKYTTTLESDRSFEGMGPFVQWDGSLPVLGAEELGQVSVDWTVGGGVLFGSQDMASEETRYADRFELFGGGVFLDDVVTSSRSEDASVPNLSLNLGLSYSIDRVKVSTGYAYDRFFDAIDGGVDEAQQYDRTIHGPYLKLSLGFGG